MGTRVLLTNEEAGPAVDEGGGVRYVARQPIMDKRGQVHAYELLFRAGPEAAFRGDGDMATRTMLDNSVMFGLETLTGGLPAFVNCTPESLTEDLVQVLPPSMTVLEILETIEPTAAIVAACGRMKRAGFRLALDDFIWAPKFQPLVDIADYIKVDFALTDAAARKQLLHELRGATVALLAEKVETQAEYAQACREGFTLFQGYYFCRPMMIENRKVPANRLSQLELLQLLRGQTLDLLKVTALVKRDASLTYRLLRLVNSPLYPIRHEVKSIHSALMAVGEDTFRRIATLAITSELNGNQPLELLRMAFVRGRFCETAGEHFGMDATEQYLTGLVSLLPAMLQVPMAELTPAMPLRTEIRHALEGEANYERGLLAWAECQERADWAGCDAAAQANGFKQDALMGLYADALVWAEEILRFAR